MDLRELNYILIPRSNDTWEAWRRTRSGRVLWWLSGPVRALTREGQVVAVATLVGAAAGVDVGGSHLYLVFAGLVSLLVAAFLLRPLASLPGVRVRVERPERVEAGAAATLTVVIENTGDRPRYALRIQGPFLPWDGRWVGSTGAVERLDPGATVRVPVQVRFLCRGDRLVGRLQVTSLRPLGLVHGAPCASEPVRLMVVPRRVAPPAVAPLALAAQSGPAPRRALPGGERWAGVRPYRPGDRIRDLHARSWARLGEPMVRTFERPRRTRAEVWLAPQVRRHDREVFDAALGLAAGLLAQGGAEAEAAVRLRALGPTPDPGVSVGGGAGAGALDRALDRLAALKPQPVAAPPLPPLEPGVPVQLVLCDWGPAAAAIWAAVRAVAPGARGWVVVRSATAATAARAVGLEALALRELRALAAPR